MSYKAVVIIAVLAVFAIYLTICAIKKQIKCRNIVYTSIISVIICAAILFTNIQSVSDYYLVHIDDITPQSKTVFISIECKNALKYSNTELKIKEKLPKNGVILDKTEYVLRDGDTAFDMLLRCTRHNKIQLEYEGTREKTAYIKGLGYLYEFDCGSLSGWMYLVNGKLADVGCAEYKLKDGDQISWIYSLNIGKDIEP